jgi:hypothetical protein
MCIIKSLTVDREGWSPVTQNMGFQKNRHKNRNILCPEELGPKIKKVPYIFFRNRK